MRIMTDTMLHGAASEATPERSELAGVLNVPKGGGGYPAAE